MVGLSRAPGGSCRWRRSSSCSGAGVCRHLRRWRWHSGHRGRRRAPARCGGGHRQGPRLRACSPVTSARSCSCSPPMWTPSTPTTAPPGSDRSSPPPRPGCAAHAFGRRLDGSQGRGRCAGSWSAPADAGSSAASQNSTRCSAPAPAPRCGPKVQISNTERQARDDRAATGNIAGSRIGGRNPPQGDRPPPPAPEHTRLTPANAEALLFDDVIWVQRAEQEHDAFVSVLRDRDIDVLYVEQLLRDVLDIPGRARMGARSRAR